MCGVFACHMCPVHCCFFLRLQAVGEVCPAVAQELGLGPGVTVSPGSGDNAMSALGAGITQ
jgi:sugar (pentulose or hexulose) kinase